MALVAQELTKVTIDLEKKLHTELKVYAAKHNTTIREIVTQACERFLKEA